ncbi:MAG: EAL domain-containing protein [Gammaproteobacteria bacterium]
MPNHPNNQVEFDLTRSDMARRRLQIRAVSGIVATGLLLGAVFTVLLYRSEMRHLEADLLMATRLRSAALESEINRLKDITEQITSRTQIRQELEKYNRGQIDLRSLTAFTLPKLADAMRLTPDVTGVSRLDSNGNPIIQVGETIPRAYWPENFHDEVFRLGTPGEIDGRPRLVLSAPIRNREGRKVGIDLVAFDYRRLDAILQASFGPNHYSEKLGIVAAGNGEVKYLLMSDALRESPVPPGVNGKIMEILAAERDGLHRLGAPDGKDMLIVQHPIGDNDWVFLYHDSMSHFLAPVLLRISYTAIAIFILTFIGSALTVLAIRPLAGSISVETNKLFNLLKEYKSLLDKMQSSESRLREAQQSAHIGSWELLWNEDKFWWSDEVFRIFEMEPREGGVSYPLFLDFVHPEDRESVDRVLSESMNSRSPSDIVHRLQFPDGRLKYLKLSGKAIFDGTVNRNRCSGTVQDITEQYRQEQEKNRLHAILNALVEGSSDAIFVKDRESRYLLVNQALAALFNRAKEDIVGATDGDLFPKNLARKFRQDDRVAMNLMRTNTFEEQVIIAGRSISYLTTKGPLVIDGDVQGVFGIARDITERKQTEKRLRESERSYRRLFNSVQDGITIHNVDGRILDVNRSVETMHGYPREYFIGKTLADLTATEKTDRRTLDRIWHRVLSGEVRHLDFWGQHADGSIIPEDVVFNKGQFKGQEVIIAVARNISDQMENRARLARAETVWTLAMDQFNDAVYLIDLQRMLVRANRAFYRLIGSDAAHSLGRPVSELVHPVGELENCPVCTAQKALEEGAFTLEADDPFNPCGYPVEVNLKLVRDDSGESCGMLTSIRDLRKSRKIEERLRLAASVFENTGEGVVIIDVNGQVAETNRAFTDIMGYARQEALGCHPRIWLPQQQGSRIIRNIWRALRKTGEWRGELWCRRKDGSVFPELLTVSRVLDEQGRLTHYVGVFTDISQIKQSQQQLDHLAHHDALTGLPNRLLLNLRLDQAIRHAERQSTRLAVVFQDLDNFKNINDSFGHPVGDRLLQKVAVKLESSVRKEDTVARLGGDEFVTILENVGKPENVSVAVEKLMLAFAEPFDLGEHEIRVTTSIGISLYPEDGGDVPTLLRNADAAMYRAKADGRNTFQFYTEDMTRNAYERVFLENNLRRAIEEGQLHLLYQPQVDLSSKRIIGVEALLRWTHPDLGMISPAKFIPLAEECGLIIAIGEWVLYTACRQGKQWLDMGIDFGRIAVNVSGIQIQRGVLLDEVKSALAASGLPASRLELEVTEGLIMQQAEFAVLQLGKLRELGVRLSIDDFGIGYSSLSYLKKLPIHKLKIDKSFVRDIPDDANDMAISDAVIAMGRSLGLTVIAEGVETEAQWQFLSASGCEAGQGYLFGRPLPPGTLEKLMGKLT